MNIGLFGFGVVGSGVVSLIDNKNTSYLQQLNINKICVRNKNKYTDARLTDNPDDIFDNEDIDIVIECIGGLHPAYDYVKKALLSHKHVVTSNKKMLATYGKELFSIAQQNHVYLKYEACVAGGITWIKSIQHHRQIESIHHFNGIFNGTTNYILSQMSQYNLQFEQALHQAQKLGYAEADPSDDISGYDSAYKVILSALSCFDSYLDFNQITKYGIENISKQDIDYALSQNACIKLIGHCDISNNQLNAYVIPTILSNDTLLANVNENYNAIALNTSSLRDVIYYGQGAGSFPTANAVVSDVIDILNHDIPYYPLNYTYALNTTYTSDFYIHCDTLDKLELNHYNYTQVEHGIIVKSITFQQLENLINPIIQSKPFIAEVLL